MAIQYQEGALTHRIPRSDLAKLVQPSSAPAISIFISTQRITIRPKRDQIKLKNLLNQAEKKLSELGYRSPEIIKILAPARALHENSLFWRHQGEGLAVYLAPNLFYCYRLPFPVKELLVVSSRFHLKPILALFCRRWKYYLLALSQKKSRLFLCSPYHLEEVKSVDLPQGIEEISPGEERKRLNFYNLGRGGQKIFHGHGGISEDLKNKLSQYFQRVDRALVKFLKEENSPLVLASVDYFLPIYQKASRYPHLIDEVVKGNPDQMKSTKLQAEAWKAIAPYFQQEKKKDIENYRRLNGTGRASGNLEEVVKAVSQGRVSVLLIAEDQEKWGRVEDNGRVEVRDQGPQPGDVDLIDWMAVKVFEQGQRLHLVNVSEMPEGRPALAVFHY